MACEGQLRERQYSHHIITIYIIEIPYDQAKQIQRLLYSVHGPFKYNIKDLRALSPKRAMGRCFQHFEHFPLNYECLLVYIYI